MTEEIKAESNENCEVIVKVCGDVRTAEVSIDEYNKHERVIKAWCNGKNVEIYGDGFWHYRICPSWLKDDVYRVEPKKPKQGEIWKDADNYLYIYTTAGFASLSSGKLLSYVEFSFVADSFEDWLVKYEQSLSSTGDHPLCSS